MNSAATATRTGTTEIARYMSTTRRSWGLVIHRRDNGRYTVSQVSRVNGHLTYLAFDEVATEAEARAVANRQWRIGKAHGEY